jgi:hypothetical protein
MNNNMILYCHICYMDGDWMEDISGEDYDNAYQMLKSEFGFGDVIYVSF